MNPENESISNPYFWPYDITIFIHFEQSSGKSEMKWNENYFGDVDGDGPLVVVGATAAADSVRILHLHQAHIYG